MASKKGITIGIDPGVTGAIVVVDGKKKTFYDMPVRNVFWYSKTKFKRCVSLDGLLKIFKEVKKENKGREITVKMEGVAARPNYNVTITWSLSASFHLAVSAAIHVFGEANVLTIQSNLWKRHFDLIGEPKKASLLRATGLYPELADTDLRYCKYVDRAEALLIATIPSSKFRNFESEVL